MANKFVDYRKELNNTLHFKETLAEYYRLINKECVKVDQPPIIKFDDIPESKIKYTHHFACKGGLHIGQLKLFLCEMQFLTNYFIKNPAELKKTVYLVYAGSAPGHHTLILSSFFQNVKFILVDPNRFELRIDAKRTSYNHYGMSLIYKDNEFIYLESKYIDSLKPIPQTEWVNMISDSKTPNRVFMIENYFTDSMAKMFAPLNPIFWSDIRTNENDDDEPSDLDFLWNCAQQLNWANLINPRALMLKFRVPFFKMKEIIPNRDQMEVFNMSKIFGVDFIGDYNNRQFRYIAGEIYLQAFPGNASNESRLCVFDLKRDKTNDGKLKYKNYDVDEYESKFFYYNIFERTLIHRANLFANKKLGFDHCNDCAIESQILQNYNKHIKKINITNILSSICDYVNKPLILKLHGNFFYPNMKTIRDITNYIHIDQKKITPKIIDGLKIKKGEDYTLSSKEIMENLIKLIPGRDKELYKKSILDNICLNKNIYETYGEMKNSIPFYYNIKLGSSWRIYYNVNRRKLLMLIKLIMQIPNVQTAQSQKNIILIYAGMVKLDLLNFLANLFNIKIYKITEGKNEMVGKINVVPSYKHIPASDIKLFYFDIGGMDEQCKNIQEKYNLVDQIIKAHKPNYSLVRIDIVTYFDCKFIKKNAKIPINTEFSPIIMNFYKHDVWIAPYEHNKSTMIYMYITNYKKEKIDFSVYLGKHAYYLIIFRLFSYFENENANRSIGYDHCYDCALENKILKSFAMRMNMNLAEIFNAINKVTETNFHSNMHGSIFPELFKTKDGYLQWFFNNLKIFDVIEKIK